MLCTEAYLVSTVVLRLQQDMQLCLAPSHHCQSAAGTADMHGTLDLARLTLIRSNAAGK